MRTLRYLLSWYFWILACFTVPIAVFIEPASLLREAIKGHASLRTTILFVMEFATVLAAFFFIKAWWVLRRDSRRARFWCMAGSIVSLILPIGFPSLYLVNGRVSEIWWSAKFFALPVFVAIVAFLFGFTDAAKPLPSPLKEQDPSEELS